MTSRERTGAAPPAMSDPRAARIPRRRAPVLFSAIMPRSPRRLRPLAGTVPLAVLLLLGSGCGPEAKQNAASPTEVESLPPASEAVPPSGDPTPSHRPATSRSSTGHTASATNPSARTSTPAPTASSADRGRTRHTEPPATKKKTTTRTTSARTTSASTTSFDRALVAAVNELRAEKGLRPVRVSRTLERQAEACSARNVDEDHLRHCGYENLYSTTADHVDPETVVAAWAKSKPHRAAMLSPTALYAGGGIESDGTKTVVALRLGLTNTGLA